MYQLDKSAWQPKPYHAYNDKITRLLYISVGIENFWQVPNQFSTIFHHQILYHTLYGSVINCRYIPLWSGLRHSLKLCYHLNNTPLHHSGKHYSGHSECIPWVTPAAWSPATITTTVSGRWPISMCGWVWWCNWWLVMTVTTSILIGGSACR